MRKDRLSALPRMQFLRRTKVIQIRWDLERGPRCEAMKMMGIERMSNQVCRLRFAAAFEFN